MGITPQLTDAELVTLAVMQALLGFTCEARWLRHARATCGTCSRTCPSSPATTSGCAPPPALISALIRMLAADTSLWTDDVWVVDSTPVECGRSRETAKRSDLAGWAEYGYCASHSRYFWGLRLHLVVHPARAAGRVRPDRRQGRRARRSCWASSPPTRPWPPARPGQILIGDKNYYGARVRGRPGRRGLSLLRPARKGEPEREPAPGSSSHCARSSSRSTTPSKASSTSNSTAAIPPPASSSASCSASSP